jgi:class 3 adenylate cyclase
MSQSQKLLEQLENANGQTQHVLCFIFDIRGFTNFCKIEDSYNIANFVRRVYINVIKDYFPDATYYKPTGDGLLIIFRCTPKKVGEITSSVLERSIKLVDDFPTLCKGDKLVYFKTPPNIGIGLSRGSACCISSEDEIIDYSGKPLNLSSRLSDMARPLGVVFDESVSSCIPNDELEKTFLNDNVYVKGLAEEEPIKVHHTKNVDIPCAYKKPLNEPQWTTDSCDVALNQFTTGSVQFRVPLTKTPEDESLILLRLSYRRIDADSVSSMTWHMTENPNVFFLKEGKEQFIIFDKKYVSNQINLTNLIPDQKIIVECIYSVKR